MVETRQTPFQILLVTVDYLEPKISNNLTLFFLLSGSVLVRTGRKEHLLQEDDLLVINPLQQYQISSTDKGVLFLLHIDRIPIRSNGKRQWLPMIECVTTEATRDEPKFAELREAVVHLMAVYFKQNTDDELEIYQYLFTVLATLVKKFKKKIETVQPLTIAVHDQQVNQLLVFIQKEYDQPLSLTLLAEKSGLSYYHLSRQFKKSIGMTFTEYVNQLRLSHATEELLLTTHSIVKVAINNGFASVKNFHRLFKKKYGVTPKNYRQNYSLTNQQRINGQRESAYEEITGDRALQELAKYLLDKDIDDQNAVVQQQVQVDVSTDKQVVYLNNKKIIKIGSVKEGLDSGIQHELIILQKELAFDSIQFSGFYEETNVKDDVALLSRYILNDRWFDFLVSIQLKPLIQLFPPADCTSKATVEWWCDQQLQLIRHCLNRYGKQEVAQWFIQWSESKQGVWTDVSTWGYTYFYRKLKQLLPTFQLGILSLCSLATEEYQAYQAFIHKQRSQQCLPDFISFQADPYLSPAIRESHSLHFKEYQHQILAKVKAVIAANQPKQVENGQNWQPALFLTNWNTLVGEGNTFAGTFFRSALILEALLDLSNEVDGVAFWLNIKVKECQTQLREDSSLSVFLYEELRRPLFFTLRFLNELSGALLARGPGYLLTCKNERWQLLVYNSSYLDPLSSVDSFQVHYQTKKLQVQLKKLPAGNYFVREYLLDKDHGGIYNDWMRMGGQREMDVALRHYLQQKILPRVNCKEEQVNQAGYTIETVLTLNACALYLIQPMY